MAGRGEGGGRPTKPAGEVNPGLTKDEDNIIGGSHIQMFMFQSSMKQLLPCLLQERTSNDRLTSWPTGLLCTVASPLLRESEVSPHSSHQPFSHWLCGVLPLSPTTTPSTAACDSLSDCRHTVFQAVATLLAAGSNVTSSSVFESCSNEIKVSVTGELATLVEFSYHIHKSSHADQTPDEERERPDNLMGNVLENDGKLSGHTEHHLATHLMFSVHLDTLAMLAYSIPHVSLLWSRDRRFVDQFIGREDSEHIVFRPYSLFPPRYVHDVSFWLPAQLRSRPVTECDEKWLRGTVNGEVTRAVRGVAGSRAVRVSHVETYKRKEGEVDTGWKEGESVEEGEKEGEGVGKEECRELEVGGGGRGEGEYVLPGGVLLSWRCSLSLNDQRSTAESEEGTGQPNHWPGTTLAPPIMPQFCTIIITTVSFMFCETSFPSCYSSYCEA